MVSRPCSVSRSEGICTNDKQRYLLLQTSVGGNTGPSHTGRGSHAYGYTESYGCVHRRPMQGIESEGTMLFDRHPCFDSQYDGDQRSEERLLL